MDLGTCVKVAVRIRPLSSEDSNDDGTLCINTVPGVPQVYYYTIWLFYKLEELLQYYDSLQNSLSLIYFKIRS
jgi:hypothetical protein